MKTLVTGGAGFIGSHITDYLLMENISEIILLRDRFRSKIIPLIQDYFYEDMNEVHKILGDGFIDKAKETVKEEKPEEPETEKQEKACLLYTSPSPRD